MSGPHPPSQRVIRARHIAPMSSPVVEDGCVIVEGDRIVAVGPTSRLKPSQIDEDIDGVLMPGLINAHTHLELSDCQQGDRPRDFGQWLLRLIERSIRIGPVSASVIEAAVALGVSESLRFGVTTVGDIAKHAAVARPVLARSPLRGVSFGEVQALSHRRGLLDERFAVASDTSAETENLRIGISPHAPYTIEPAGYRRCLEWAQREGRPITTHLAETLAEQEFLNAHTGPLRHLWDAIGGLDAAVPKFAGTPIEYAQSLGLLEYLTLLAHVNYCSDSDLDLLAAGRASVVWCPRTHQYFGHPPHRWREMRDHGITVCVGTDSCASSPSLDIVDDLRLVHADYPDEPPESIWSLATTSAATALRWPGGPIGALAPGAMADFVAFATRSSDPLREILETPAMLPTHVWISGETVTP